MNKVIMMGRLTREPEVRYSGGESSTTIARFGIAVDRRRRGQDGVEADFFNCTAFGRLAEFVEKYLKKGTKIVLVGRVQNDNYTNRDGQKVSSVQIIADEIEFAESKNASGERRSEGTMSFQERPSNPVDEGFMNVPDTGDDEGIPFF